MFELTFLGASGGPLESGTCALLIKPQHLSYRDLVKKGTLGQEILMVDAGSGLSSLTDIIRNEQKGKTRCAPYYSDSNSPKSYCAVDLSRPFSSLKGDPFFLAQQILSACVNCTITHPHLDHVTALVINSPFYTAWGTGKNIYGSRKTIDSLKTHVFNGIIWPNLPFLAFHKLSFGASTPLKNSRYCIQSLQLSHGSINGSETYSSTAFLVTYNASNRILVFGDFESDSSSRLDLNKQVWRAVVPHIAQGSLRTIVLECSNSNSTQELYGHLNPTHLTSELQCLKHEYTKTTGKRLPRLNIVVTHVKEALGNCGDPRKVILSELKALASEKALDVSFSMATTGVTMVVP